MENGREAAAKTTVAPSGTLEACRSPAPMPRWQRPATLFALMAGVLGWFYLIVTPPMRAPDERRHIRRIVQLASGGVTHPVPIPSGAAELVEAGRIVGRHHGLRRRSELPYSFRDLSHLAAIQLRADEGVEFAGDRTMEYSPVPYLPAVAIVWIGIRTNLRPIVLLYASRVTLFVSGVWLLYLAIRLVPDLQWMLCALALLPTVTFLRSCVSADTLTTAFSFLLFALVVRLRDASRPVERKHLVLLAAVGSSLALAKIVYLPLTLAVVPVLVHRLGSRRGRYASTALVALLPWVLGMSWLWALGDSVAIGDPIRAQPEAQLALLLHEPARFVHVFMQSWLSPAAMQTMSQWLVGRLLLMNLRIPWPFVIVCLGLLALLAFATPASCAPRPLERGAFLLSALACTLILSLGAYLKWSTLGRENIQGIQGRYLIPLLPYLSFALLPPQRLRWRWSNSLTATVVLVVLLASNLWGVGAIVSSTWGAGVNGRTNVVQPIHGPDAN